MEKGIMYLVWGKYNRTELEKSIQSIAKTNLPYQVVETNGNTFWENKSQIFEKAPFDLCLYLDTDTLVMDADIEHGFRMAEQHDIAMSNDPISRSNRWGDKHKDFTEWNTGVIFFNRKSDGVKTLSKTWRKIGDLGNPRADQMSFSMAVQESKVNPFWLPNNWNFFATMSPSPITGEIKIWHSHDCNPHVNIEEWNKLNKNAHKKVAQYSYPNYFRIIFD